MTPSLRLPVGVLLLATTSSSLFVQKKVDAAACSKTGLRKAVNEVRYLIFDHQAWHLSKDGEFSSLLFSRQPWWWWPQLLKWERQVVGCTQLLCRSIQSTLTLSMQDLPNYYQQLILSGWGALQGLPFNDTISSPTCSSLPFFTLLKPPSSLLHTTGSFSRSPLPPTVGHQKLFGQLQAVPHCTPEDGEEGHPGEGQETNLPILWWVNSKSPFTIFPCFHLLCFISCVSFVLKRMESCA